MKKSLSIIGIVVGVLILIALIMAPNNTHKKTVATSPAKSSSDYPIYKACDILTAAIATQLVGNDASSKSQPDTQAHSVNVSDCSYYSAANKLSVGLLARSPLDATAAVSNVNQFGSGKPVGVQLVRGYGDAAYWFASVGQLNILEHNTWYILTFGPLNPSQATLTQTEQFANLVKDKL